MLVLRKYENGWFSWLVNETRLTFSLHLGFTKIISLGQVKRDALFCYFRFLVFPILSFDFTIGSAKRGFKIQTKTVQLSHKFRVPQVHISAVKHFLSTELIIH